VVTWVKNNGNFVAYKGGKLAGMVCQNPDSPLVMDPLMWTCVFYTADEGIMVLPLRNTALRARIAVSNALKRRWTYDIWQRSSPHWRHT
jgi:hypothetical protein